MPSIAIAPLCHLTQYGAIALAILPFIEQSQLYSEYNSGVPWNHTSNQKVVATVVKAYICPSDFVAAQTPVEFPATPSLNVACAHGSYKAVGGAYNPSNPDQYYWTNCTYDHAYNPKYRGVLHNSGGGCAIATYESLTTITDGASNTLMVGEASYYNPTSRSTFWANGYDQYSVGAVNSYSGQFGHDFTNAPCSANWYCRWGFNSYHPGGQNFVYCDGTCHFISANIDLVSIYPALATIAGGEVVSLP